MDPSVLSPGAPGRGTPCCHLGLDDSLAFNGLYCTERLSSAGVSTLAVPQRRLTCRAHQRTPLVWRHVAYDGFDNYRGELLIIYRIHANHGWFLRKRSSLHPGAVGMQFYFKARSQKRILTVARHERSSYHGPACPYCIRGSGRPTLIQPRRNSGVNTLGKMAKTKVCVN